jgi:3-phenylpropionate/trans-cinnamate dioxygenase ferredoxin reductase subunit
VTARTFVIVGAGLAGSKAAEELRDRGFDGRVVLVGAEAERPYERPPLTKDYLRGESAREQAFVHPEGFYAERDIELQTGTPATAIDPHASCVRLADGRELAYDRLLLATGAEPRRLAVPGADLDGVHVLRTLGDSDALRDRLEPGVSAVVVGGGWIGSEVAASARGRGVDVTVVDPAALPNERRFGAEVAGFYRDVHLDHGVSFALGEGIASFEGHHAVTGVRTTSGRLIACDVAVVGVGVAPTVELARTAGLAVDDGVLVGDDLRTSARDVFACGDVARTWHPFYRDRLRVEHWATALTQGPAAARAMLGEPTSYDELPFFFSDQYEVGMEYTGRATGSDEVALRGDPADGAFLAFWLRDGRVVAGMDVNVGDVGEQVQALIRSRRVIDRARLSDRGSALDALVAEPVRRA